MIISINEWRLFVESNSLPDAIEMYLYNFPDDATSWDQATDEIRDLARTVKEYYNEIDLDLTHAEVENGKGLQPLDFRSIKTPADWNRLGKEYIRKAYSMMSSSTKLLFLDEFKENRQQ